MKLFKGSKKGSALDLVFIAVGVATMAFILLMMFTFNSVIFQKMIDTGMFPQTAIDTMASVLNTYTGIADKGVIIILVGLALAAICLASLTYVSPVFYIFYVISIILITIFCAFLSNMYEVFAANPIMAPYASSLVVTAFVMNKLPFFVGIFGFVIAIVMYRVKSGMSQ